MIKSRYTDITEVDFKESDLPDDLRVIHALCSEWCLNDQEEVELLARSKSREELQGFLNLFFSKQEVIESFLEKTQSSIPIPDEAVIVDLAFQAYDLLFTFSEEYKPEL